MEYTITFTDGTSRTVKAGSYGVGDGKLEFFDGPIPAGDPILTVSIVDGEGRSTLASLSSDQGA